MTSKIPALLAVAAAVGVLVAGGVAHYADRPIKPERPREMPGARPAPLPYLGWYYAPGREGPALHVTYASPGAPEKNVRVDVLDVQAAKALLAWARGGQTAEVSFVNRAVRGDREGVPGMLHAGYEPSRDATPPRRWDVEKDLPDDIRALVGTVDSAAEAAALSAEKEKGRP